MNKKHYAAILAFIFLGIFITSPLIFHLGDRATGYGDELLLSWIQSWVKHSLLFHPLKLFEAPIYYPYHHSLAYSDILITSSLLFAIPVSFIGQPIAYQNLSLISSLVLLAYAIYILSYYLINDRVISFIAGLLVMFSPVVLDKYVHLQVLFIFFVPLSIYFFFKFIESRETKLLILTMLCFVLQTYNSFLPGYFILFSLMIIFITYLFSGKVSIKKFIVKKDLVVIGLALLSIIPITIPYYQVSKEFNYTRDIRDAIHFANQPEDFFYTNEFSRLAPLFDLLWQRKSYPPSVSFKNGFPGLAFSVLIVLSFVFVVRKWRELSYQIKSMVFIALTGLILSLGPFMHIARHTIHHPFPIPLPYAVLYYLAPGFNGMRNTARWEMLFVIASAVLAAFVMQKLLASLNNEKRIGVFCLVALITLLEFQSSFQFVPITPKKEFPEEYAWLSKRDKNAVVIHMPIYNWNMFPYAGEELTRQYYMTVNFRRMVNGGSGFSPPPWQKEVIHLASEFPADTALSELKKLGVTFIFVHRDEYDQLHRDGYTLELQKMPNSSEVTRVLHESKKVKEVKSFKDTTVYRII